MNRAVSVILIPLLLVMQSLFCVPHSHAGSSIAEPEGHAARPHVHLHDADHQHGPHSHHSDGIETPPSTPDHDSDAIYAADYQLFHDGKVAKVAAPELTALYVTWGESAAHVSLCRLCSPLLSPPMLRPKCARYLQLLSIRC